MHSTTCARDYLGHPCMVTAVHERVFESVKESRRRHDGRDPRSLPRDIGRALHALIERLECATYALEALAAALPDDSDEPAALVAMASEYSRKTEDQFADLAALVLLALERGGLATLPGPDAAS